MKRSFASLAAACGAVSLVAAGLSAQNPVSSAVQRNAGRAARNLTESADEMPADKYGFKPTPAQMSFADVVVHLVDGNYAMCSWAAGTQAPDHAKVASTDPKDKLVPALKQSFDYCNTSLAKIDDSKLADSVPFFGGHKVSRATAMVVLVDDWADHYSQLAIYLRLNNLLPPTAKRNEM